MKMKKTIEKLEVVIIIESGATHNFVAPQVVAKTKIPLVKDIYLQVLDTEVTVEGL